MNKYYIQFFLICISLLISSCGTTWVVRRDRQGGTIGYKGFSSGKDADIAIEKLIHCPNYSFESDELKQSTGTAIIPMQTTNYNSGTVYNGYGSANYNQQSTQTNYIPVTVNNSWREFAYKCNDLTESQVMNNSDVLFLNSNSENTNNVAIIDLKKVVQNSIEGKNAKAKLESKFNEVKRKLQIEEIRVKALPEPEKNIEFQKFKTLVKHEEKQIKEYEQQITSPILKEINEIISVIAIKKSYYKVLNREVSNGSDDISHEVLVLYNERSK